MDTPFRINVGELKEWLQVFKIKLPEDELVDNYVAVEAALKAEVNEIVDAIGVEEADGSGIIVYPAKVPRTKARMLIRSMFAAIEGSIYCLKQLAFSMNTSEGPLTLDELLICREATFGLKDNGEVYRDRMRLKFEPNLKFAFKAIAKVMHEVVRLDTNCPGWNRLVQSVKVRNRLAHPKRAADLDLTDDELRHAIEGYVWFEEQIGSLFRSASARAKQTTHYLEAWLKHMESVGVSHEEGAK